MDAAAATVLVVDDNQDNRDLISRRLQRSGYQVLTAENGPEGIEAVRNGGVDLVILDVMMPGLSGIDVLQILRQTHSAADLPIIMATAKNQSEDMVEALSNGANDYVTKPLDFPVVLARVEAQLRTRAAQKSPPKTDPVAFFGAIGPGAVLAGKYRLEEELGAGNFGSVYRATHLDFEQSVAVKMLQAPVDETSETLARFRQEGTSAFRLQHPNVVSVMDFSFGENGLAFLVMELLEGHTLEQELKRRGKLSPERCGEIAQPICEALAEAHALGIIHRDIKPANIYLHQTRRGEVVKVLDFGIAKLVGEAAMGQHLTLDEGILGTPAYMAPERLSGAAYDGRSDVYSLGIVLYQLLAGHPPFESEKNEAMAVAMMHLTTQPQPLQEARPDISEALAALVMQTLIKDPDLRPTAADLAQSLVEALEDEVTHKIPQASTPGSSWAAADSEAKTGKTPPIRIPPPAEDFDFSLLLEPPPRSGNTSETLPPVVAPREIGQPWT
ncbi:MAG: protein kinase [Acidobacteriota bacterium]